MAGYLLKILILVLFSFLIIFFYYSPSLSHVENFNGYLPYFLSVGITYIIYKYYQIQFIGEKVRFSLVQISGFFFLHLFILSTLFFHYSGLELSLGITLFFKIIMYSIIPTTIVFISIGFGKKLLNILGIDSDTLSFHLEEDKHGIFTFLVSLGLGFFSFIYLLTIIGFLGFYNLWVVFGLLMLFAIFSYKELLSLGKGFGNYKIEFKNHNLKSNNLIKKVALKLLTTEFLFIVASLIISISLINIVRPMPIGWDDLGVYMNYPRQLAHAGEIFNLPSMYAWQVFTGIGFMIGEPTQAFFLNNVGGILSFLVIFLVSCDLLSFNKKNYINIPLLLATIFISMPMIVFQQAKDMKLDPGLFFVSLIALYAVYKIFFTNLYIKKKDFGFFRKLNNSDKLSKDEKTSISHLLKILFVIGLISGFAFSIKFTSILLISSIIGILFYVGLGSFGFMGYIFMFLALFTKLGLWNYLNVIYPKDNLDFVNIFSFFSLVIGGLLISVGLFKYKLGELKKLLILLGVFILGILIALLPWVGKNIYSSPTNLSIGTLISGKADRFNVDYTKIYTKEELKKIEDDFSTKRGLTESGTTSNEDFGRYFGYEKGINNYVKLPWNLTFQLNQGGEFTTIGFLFLALIPGLLLFLPYRKDSLSLGVLSILILELLLFVIPSSKQYFTNLFSDINLPFGYLVIFLMFLVPFVYLLISLKHTRLMTLFKINLVFIFFYVFLWVISAFGIVWYGIMMYFSFLLIIGICMHYLSGYKLEDSNKTLTIKFFGTLSVLIIFLVWFFASVIPHSFNNLKTAYYPYYKSSKYTSDELVFGYHNDYLKMLFNLNIEKTKQKEFLLSNIKDDTLKSIVSPYVDDIYLLNEFLKVAEAGIFDKIFGAEALSKIDPIVLDKFRVEAGKAKRAIYAGILKPEEKYKNKDGIYRIGTFLLYFISENNTRIFNDNLIFHFDKYIYDDNFDKSIDRMKKLGLNYLLVDLNAATIDKDPRRDLTRRYENLLKTFTSSKLNLIETDSICLKYALESYNDSEKTTEDLENYLNIAGVNHESYTEEDKTISRSQKQIFCYSKIVETINNLQVKDGKYSYLEDIQQKLLSNRDMLDTDEKIIREIAKLAPHGARVLFEIK